MPSTNGGDDDDVKAKLVAAVKKEVKQVMEESVTRTCVHEESASVTTLCGAVEACLSHGLRRRALGLFKTSSTTALLHKIAKHCDAAEAISRRVLDVDSTTQRRSSSSSDSVSKVTPRKPAAAVVVVPKYLWIRFALFDKQLATIIDHLVANANAYYDKEALVADADYGNILSSLLVGPCALNYSRAAHTHHDHYYSDPPADELLQRSRISSAHSTPPPVRRPINFRRSLNTSAEDCGMTTQYARVYVESLHQNSRTTLLFGKNNVHVVYADAMPGYLGLYQSAHALTIKWTPNQLMNGCADEVTDTSVYWDYALQVRLDEIVYVHCHQAADTGGTVILVGQDGVQRPPIRFPRGDGHLLAFLSCIETGLLPHGRLDPPLWSSSATCNRKKKKKRRALAMQDGDRDVVFRIIGGHPATSPAMTRSDLLDPHATLPCSKLQMASSSTSSESVEPPQRTLRIRAVCASMKRQIISRAFYGWLAYCRHLRTVRTHLAGLVNAEIVGGEGAAEGVTQVQWDALCVDGVCRDAGELFRLAYFGGVANVTLRRTVWPYLLGHHKFGSTCEERRVLDEETRQAYENTMSEWLAVEAIVRQRDKESQAKAVAQLSSDSDQQVFTNEEEVEEDVEVIVTTASVDISVVQIKEASLGGGDDDTNDSCLETHGLVSPACVSPASSNGGVYSVTIPVIPNIPNLNIHPIPLKIELLNEFGLNLHRIEKDVQRCDRNFWYFAGGENLDKLRNVMCTYVWEHLDVGYMQGMCDLVAPLLVVFNDESLTYACFCHLMERMVENFPSGGAMDGHFANMRSLIQVLDGELYELMLAHADYTHFYFCYRWFLLDFKRELIYEDVYSAWETIWAAQRMSSAHFVLFLALAFLETYRDIILSNCMDFTDIIKFFNEMAERHDATAVIQLARELVLQLQLLIENK